MFKKKIAAVISILLCIFIVAGTVPAYAAGNSSTDAKGDTATVWFIFVNMREKPFVAIYMHMKSEPNVSRGQKISQGKELGYVGTTGNSSGNHLHFEVNNQTASIYESNGVEASDSGRKSYNDLINPIFFFIAYNPNTKNVTNAYWYGSE